VLGQARKLPFKIETLLKRQRGVRVHVLFWATFAFLPFGLSLLGLFGEGGNLDTWQHISAAIARGAVKSFSYGVFNQPGSFGSGAMTANPNLSGVLRADEAEVWLCRRPVDDWRVRLAIPGAEHYSIWLPKAKLHRGVIAAGPGQPLYWVDEVFLDEAATAADWVGKGLTCEPVAADVACVVAEVTRQRDEGIYSLTNHCQNIAVDVLATCGAHVPPLVPKYPYIPDF